MPPVDAITASLLSDPYEWGDWDKKFAWLPTTVNGNRIWVSYFYERVGVHKYAISELMTHITKVQRGTIFDVLK